MSENTIDSSNNIGDVQDTSRETDMKEFKKLQKRLNHESIRHQFKKKVVGGLDEEDVTKYIEYIEGRLRQLEQNYKRATDNIYVLKNRVNAESEEKYRLEEDIRETKEELETYKFECGQKDSKINLLNGQRTSENEALKAQVEQMTGTKTELERQLGELSIKFRQTKESAQKSEEERQSLEQLLLEAKSKNEQIKEHAKALENDNFIIKERLSVLEEDKNNFDAVKEENDRMAKDIGEFEELLNQSDLELEQLRQDKDIFEKDNTLMKAKIIELENKVSAKDYKIDEVNRVCQDIKQELEIEKSCSEKLNMDLVIFKQKIISLEQTIGEKLEELEEQKISKERIEQELALEKSKLLGYRINGFKEELSDMYKKIEALEEEASQSIESNIYYHQQLEIQQKRADKAENDLVSFMKLLTGAKDKFYSERNPFGDQISQLVETEK